MVVASSRRARGLIAASLLCVVGFTVLYGREAWVDSGSFAVVLFGIPLACAAGALWAERVSRTTLAPVVLAVLGIVSLAWSLLTGLGIGLGFVPPSLLLLVAATVSWTSRHERDPATPSHT